MSEDTKNTTNRKGSVFNPWGMDDYGNNPVERGDYYKYNDKWYVAVRDGLVTNSATVDDSRVGEATFHFLGQISDPNKVEEEALELFIKMAEIHQGTGPQPTSHVQLDLEYKEKIRTILGLQKSATEKEVFENIEKLISISSVLDRVLEKTS